MTTGTTIGDALRTAALRLDRVGESGRADAELLLEHAAGQPRTLFVTHPDRVLDAETAARFGALVAEREGGRPVAYIVGEAWFAGRPFNVDARVLVPRPETELIVEAAISDLRARRRERGRAADVGTGSGAIAVTLACALPDLSVFGTDISQDALTVARRNAARNRVFQHCTFLHGDLAEPLRRFAPFDLIVANLPYIPSADVPAAPDPVSHEPRLALDGGPDGLDPYRRLIAQLPDVLASGGSAFLEAAPPTIEALAELADAAFPGGMVVVGEDYAGLDRWVEVTAGP